MSPVAKILLYWYISIFLTIKILSFFILLSRPFFLTFQLIALIILLRFLNIDFYKLRKSINFKSKASIIIIVLLALTFIQGFLSAPSTTDSMVYHLPRIMYWIQEKTVYQEVIRNEHDFMAPFGEYILLSLYLSLGNDRLVFLSQWIAYAVAIYISGIVAGQLGADKKQKNIIRIFTATLPIALMQSVSTQVDLVVTVLLLIATHTSLLLLKKFTLRYVFVLGLVFGLGILTKATFFIYAVIPFGIVIYSLRYSLFKLFTCGILILLIAGIINLHFFSQNYYLYGNFLGKHVLADGGVVVYTNESITPLGILSNALRNILVQIPVPVFSTLIETNIKNLYSYFGVNINDPLTTCCGEFQILPILYPQEDIAANPIHLFLIFLGGICLLLVKTRKVLKIFYVLILISFLMFSIILKWQPYHSRLEIPIFIFGTIAAVLSIGKITNLLRIAIVASIILGFVIVALNISRPFISYSLFYEFVNRFSQPNASVPKTFFVKPRVYQYFNARHYWYEPYNEVTDLLKGKQDVKVALDLADNYEYPLWIMLKDKNIRFEMVSLKLKDQANFLIKSSFSEKEVEDFNKIGCFKTQIDYGYACLYKR